MQERTALQLHTMTTRVVRRQRRRHTFTTKWVLGLGLGLVVSSRSAPDTHDDAYGDSFPSVNIISPFVYKTGSR